MPALVVAVVAFAVQQSGVVPAIPTVGADLHASDEFTAWLLTMYLVVATIATPAMGRLGDILGRRRMLVIGLVVFAVGSVGAALSPDLPVLIVFRAVQGVGGAVYPLALALGRSAAPEGRQGATVAWLTSAFGIGTAIGFVLGGVFAQFSTWRWIFGAGAILVAAATVLVAAAVPLDDAEDRAEGGFDVRGTAVLGGACAALLVALTLLVPLGPANPLPWVLIAVAVIGGLLWTRSERRSEHPLIDLAALTTPSVAVANLATIGVGWALFGAYLLIPRLAQAPPGRTSYGLGLDALGIGLILLPLSIAQTAASPIAGRLSSRLTPRTVFAIGLGVLAAALAAAAVLPPDVVTTAAISFVLGAGAGFALEAGSDVATSGVPAELAAESSAVNSTVRRLAGGIGGQVATLVLGAVTIGGMPALGAFRLAWGVSVVLCLGGAVLLLAGRRRAGA